MGDDPHRPVLHSGTVTDTAPSDWHLQAWMRHFGKKQASLRNELGWSKNKSNIVWHGTQPYKRELVNELAAWLGVEPYELLMKPKEALFLRRLRQAAHQIAEDIIEEREAS